MYFQIRWKSLKMIGFSCVYCGGGKHLKIGFIIGFFTVVLIVVNIVVVFVNIAFCLCIFMIESRYLFY